MIDSIDKKIICRLQEEIPITATPYKNIASEVNISERELINRIKKYKETGILKRIAGILYHRNVGFKANAMVVWNVNKNEVNTIANYIISIPAISHCYERKSYPFWNYNLYTMIHGRDKEACIDIVKDISKAEGIIDYKILYSVKELKKTSMKYFINKPKLCEQEKWEAIIAMNKYYDGIFWYGAKSTKVFCNPSCKSRKPLQKNIRTFESIEEALKLGYRPCKRCRSDLFKYNPNLDMVIEVKDFIENYYYDNEKLIEYFKQIAISKSHLVRLFKLHYDMTPKEYIIQLRMNKACSLLDNTDLDVLNVALSCGTKTLSNFYNCFKKQFKITPNEYRKRGNTIKLDVLK